MSSAGWRMLAVGGLVLSMACAGLATEKPGEKTIAAGEKKAEKITFTGRLTRYKQDDPRAAAYAAVLHGLPPDGAAPGVPWGVPDYYFIAREGKGEELAKRADGKVVKVIGTVVVVEERRRGQTRNPDGTILPFVIRHNKVLTVSGYEVLNR